MKIPLCFYVFICLFVFALLSISVNGMLRDITSQVYPSMYWCLQQTVKTQMECRRCIMRYFTRIYNVSKNKDKLHRKMETTDHPKSIVHVSNPTAVKTG